jgi:dTDP-4-dehydrorhamnose 3,5-epimerase
MNLTETAIEGLFIAGTTAFQDTRGGFARFFCAQDLQAACGGRRIVQANHSVTRQAGALRGLHFQYPPHAEMKLARCIRGRVLDVAVDLRRGSGTFLEHVAQELSPQNGLMMVIPEGFAHGFQALEPDSEMLYLHTAPYVQAAEGGIRHDDPRLGIVWPHAVTDISGRDRAHALLESDFEGITT